jgi:hypothetical protein
MLTALLWHLSWYLSRARLVYRLDLKLRDRTDANCRTWMSDGKSEVLREFWRTWIHWFVIIDVPAPAFSAD